MSYRHRTTATLSLGLCGILAMTLWLSASAADTRIADAAMNKQPDQVRALLQQGVDVNAAQGDGMTALHWAAYHNDTALAQMLLVAGAKTAAALRINAMTPLFFAAQNGSSEMITLLVNAGAQVNSVTRTGATSLMYAAKSGNSKAVELLLTKGAAVNARENARGETALMFAAAANRSEAIRVLLSHGADSSLHSNVIVIATKEAGPRGVTPVPPPAAGPVAGSGNPAQAPQRGGRGVGGGGGGDERPPAVETMGGMTPLLFAARQGHFEAVKALLDGGADINGVNAGDKTSALLIASINGHFDLAKWLLEQGANPALASTANATPLYAVLNVKWGFIAEYPQPETRNEKTPYLDLMRMMLDRGADPNVRIKNDLWYSAYGSSRTQIDAGGATPFWRAAQSSDVAAMRLLIERGADPNIRSSNGQSPLHIAAGAGVQGNQEVTVYGTWMPGVKYLVDELGIDVNQKDGKGLTALHHAAGRGDNEMILFLISKGADVTAVGKNGETVADLANGPRQRIQPFAETVALLEMLGSKNSHKCVSC